MPASTPKGFGSSSAARTPSSASSSSSSKTTTPKPTTANALALVGKENHLSVVGARDAAVVSRDKATLKEHRGALEDETREFLTREVNRLTHELHVARAEKDCVGRAAAAAVAAVANSVSVDAHDRVRLDLDEARAALDAMRIAAAAADARHELLTQDLRARLDVERERREAMVREAMDLAKEEEDARRIENDEWLLRAIEEKHELATTLERERSALASRVDELERVVVEGEACLRDAASEKEAVKRKYRRHAATETSGRLAAEASAAAARAEANSLRVVLEKFAAAGANVEWPDVRVVETVDCAASPVPASLFAPFAERLFDVAEEEDAYPRGDAPPRGSFHAEEEEEEDATTTTECASAAVPATPATPGFKKFASMERDDSAMTSGERDSRGGGGGVGGVGGVASVSSKLARLSTSSFALEYTPPCKVAGDAYRGDRALALGTAFADDETTTALAAATISQALAVVAERAPKTRDDWRRVCGWSCVVLFCVVLALATYEAYLRAFGGYGEMRAVPMRMGGVPPGMRYIRV